MSSSGEFDSLRVVRKVLLKKRMQMVEKRLLQFGRAWVRGNESMKRSEELRCR